MTVSIPLPWSKMEKPKELIFMTALLISGTTKACTFPRTLVALATKAETSTPFGGSISANTRNSPELILSLNCMEFPPVIWV
jgi:hypothetical protein